MIRWRIENQCIILRISSLSKESLRTLVHAFVTSQVHHCNGLLYGSRSYLIDRLQSVLNSAARLFSSEHRKVQRNLGYHPWRSTLAANQKTHWIQNGSSGAKFHSLHCTGVFDGTVPSCLFSRFITMPIRTYFLFAVPTLKLITFTVEYNSMSDENLNQLKIDKDFKSMKVIMIIKYHK